MKSSPWVKFVTNYYNKNLKNKTKPGTQKKYRFGDALKMAGPAYRASNGLSKSKTLKMKTHKYGKKHGGNDPTYKPKSEDDETKSEDDETNTKVVPEPSSEENEDGVDDGDKPKTPQQGGGKSKRRRHR